MIYSIKISKKAVKLLSKIELKDRLKIASRIESLKNNPHPEGNKKLKGLEELYRVRQGNFRIIVCMGILPY